MFEGFNLIVYGLVIWIIQLANIVETLTPEQWAFLNEFTGTVLNTLAIFTIFSGILIKGREWFQALKDMFN